MPCVEEMRVPVRDLASLALHAAAEIEATLTSNVPGNKSYRCALAGRLREDMQAVGGGPVKVALSPIATKALAETLGANKNPQTISDLHSIVQEFLQRIEDERSPIDIDALSDLKAKCLALHLALMKHSRSSRGDSAHPYRRGLQKVRYR